MVEEPDVTLRHMAAPIRHRGPDDEGYWWDPEAGIGLAHRRLSILDLSVEGRQPMASASGRHVIIYNGEVYNFLNLRRELMQAGIRFRGRSDTEVMLAAIECRGLESAVRQFAGMFAFALFDRETRALSLVRDRLGEKPLYYARIGHTLLFGSELKALRTHPAWRGEIDRAALALFLRYNCIPAPYSIYRGVRKVMPGTMLTFSAPDAEPASVTYWSARTAAEAGSANPLTGSDDELVTQLEGLLQDVVRREMVADVPLGAFLSGGVDSSLIVALMQAQSSRPIRTFTIGFHERAYDEAPYANAVARHLGTDHTEMYVTPADTLAVVPKLPTLYDEPFADSSQIPTFLVAALTRRHVTVSLSGDGGDELFGGYDRYAVTQRLSRWLRPVPQVARRVLAHVVRAWSPPQWDRAVRIVEPMLPWSITGDRLYKAADVLSEGSDQALYHVLMSHWQNPAAVALDAWEPSTVFTDPARWAAVRGIIPWMMYVDLVGYLPDDILVKVDRASMGVSLESRAPYLDHTVVEYAWRLPLRGKVGRGQGKRILRRLLDRYVPRNLVDRPKMGFGVPIRSWLRGPLREWAAALLDERRLRSEGFFRPEIIAAKWREHQEGTRNWHYHLWDILMFQAWLEAQR